MTDILISTLKQTIHAWFVEWLAEREAVSPEALAERKAAELRAQIIVIKAKEECSVGEAALLLGFSESKVRDFIKAAKGKKRIPSPIPFREYPGPLYTLPVRDLLAWQERYRMGGTRLYAVPEQEAA